MLVDTFANRLQKAINLNNIRPIDLANKTGIDKSQISNYLSGNYKAGQNNVSLIAKELNVSEPWLMGYDVPINEENKNTSFDELEVLFSANKDILTEDDRETIKFIINKRKKEVDSQRGQ